MELKSRKDERFIFKKDKNENELNIKNEKGVVKSSSMMKKKKKVRTFFEQNSWQQLDYVQYSEQF